MMITPQDTLNALNTRYAVKKFDSSKKLSDEYIELLEETLRLTPSSFGFEPWKFVFITDPNVRQKLFEFSPKNPQVVDAPLLIVLCAKDYVGNNDVVDLVQRTMKIRQVEEKVLGGFKKGLYRYVWARNINIWLLGIMEIISGTKVFRQWETKQVYVALGNLLTVCAYHKIDTAPMEGFNQQAYKTILSEKIEGYSPVILCAVGYHSDHDVFASMAKVRKGKEEVIIRL
ncbi:MAG: NAD(P)H-dependent oxidoreductase [Minisyncoccia bacterium]